MWKFFDRILRRLTTPAARPSTKRKSAPRSRSLLLEALEARWVPSTYSISANFTNTAVAAGDTLWFSSVVNNVTGLGYSPATIHVTNQTITFTDSFAESVSLTLPNADLTLTPGLSLATTTFDTTNVKWVTNVPTGLAGNDFLSGGELALPSGLHGGDTVTWTATFTSTASGVSFNWAWGAAAYTSFTSTYSSLNVKPCDNNSASSYLNNDPAGTPEAYKGKLTAGATGTGTGGLGGPFYIGNLSPNKSVTPTYTATYVSLAGTVYNDANNNGVFDTGDTGISGVTLTLSGTTTGNASVTATTTTASDGTYSFTTDSNGNPLVTGTYQITETEPVGYYKGSDTVGSVSGSTDGVENTVDVMSSITLAAGQSGTGYNFGEVDPFSVASVPYPYSSSNSLTNVAFNESEIMYGASVNLATSTFDIFYSDEHALCLGVNQVTVQTSSGTTTTNYSIAQLSGSSGSAANPAVGDTNVTGAAGAVDASGRPLFPSLYVTDITNDPNSMSGDWQDGGTAVTPSAIYGSWKSYALTVNETTSPATVTQSGGTDPTPANGWTLPAGADPVPASISGSNAGYGTEIQWSLSSLYTQGVLIPGHNYRFYFVVHDGDQNNGGGDVGQAAFDFTFRGPVTITGNVYNDIKQSGSLSTGDPGIGGVSVTLTGTTYTGHSVTATTTTAANGSYTFTKDSNGNLLQGGTYQVSITQPSNYLPATNSVGALTGTPVDWTQGFQEALSASGAGYVHNSADLRFTQGSKDVNGIASGWSWTTGSVPPKDWLLDAFSSVYADPSGHELLLGSVDRQSANGDSTIGFWFFQNAISLNANGSFSGIHSNGDIFVAVDFQGNGASSVAVYQWTGTDASGSLTQLTPPTGSTYLFVNTGPVTVPWPFVDGSGNTSPQAGEFLEVGVDLTALLGPILPTFKSTLAESRASTSTSAELKSFVLGGYNTVFGVNAPDGTLNPPTSIGSIAISNGENSVNYNFGLVQPVTVSGLVYQDINGTGSYSSSDTGIAGVTLTLTGTNYQGKSITATTTTGTNGTYSFTTDSNGNLLGPGTYQIVETPPAGYLPGGTNVGTVNGTTDGTAVTSGTIGSIVETTGQNGINYDFGEVKPVSISGTLYQDTNDAGTYSTSDSGLSGVTLTLTGTNNLGQTITMTVVTGANGTYSFTTDSNGNLLRPGTYTITETPLSGYLVTAATVGTVNGTPVGTAVSGTQIGSIALTSGQSATNYYFGDVKPVAISGTIYEDKNDNGVMDSGDVGIAGVSVTLSGANGQGQSITATTTTAANGTYSFTTDSNGNLLKPGTYQVTDPPPATYLVRTTNVGTVNGTVDGTAITGPAIGSILFASGQTGINYNFGDIKPVKVAGTVYEDKNDNGVLDSGEPGIGGVTLTLSGTNDQGTSITATVTTSATGTYSFTTDSSGNVLRPGTYTITETLPSGYLTGAATVGTVNGVSDGAVVSATKVGSVVLAESQSGVSYNFGNLKPVTVGGTVYEDSNDNGVLNSGEPGISGVTLTLSGTNDQGTSITATATTGSGGTYSFTTDSSGNLLRPGTYTIVETQPSGYLTGAATVGTVSGSADGTVVSSTKIGSVVLAESQSGINYNFGDIKPVTLAGTVYEDDKGLGVYTSSDAGIAGVTLTLSGTNDQGAQITATAITNASGVYSFTTDSNGNLLRPGTYQIVETAPSGYLLGAATVGTVNGSTDGTEVSLTKISSIGMTEGQSGINYNFGNVKPVTIAGIVYEDVNGTGVYGSGDNLISGVTVTLTGTNVEGVSVTATAITNASGAYSFTTDSNGNVLIPGTYQVTETPPSNYLLGKDSVGTVNGTADGSLVSFTQIGSIVMGSGQNGINYDFSNVKPVTISGLVYNDLKAVGIYQAGDPGISGVTMTLTGTNNLGQSVTATTTTGMDGTYSFSTDNSGNKLAPGTYTLTETEPNGYVPGAATVGTVNGTTVGTVASHTQISQIGLPEGQSGIHYNFGQIIPVGVAGYVYVDSNHDTVKDNGETGDGLVDQIMLTGTDYLGNSVTLYTTTDATGYYSFTNLLPGTYTVTFVSTSYPYLFEYANVGTVKGVLNGQNTASNVISQIVLNSGAAGINYDFAEIVAGS